MTEAPEPPVRIAVAGAGLIGRAHIERILREPSARLAGIADPSPAARDTAAAHGVPHAAGLPELLEVTTADAVIVAVPNHAHLAVGLEAARAGAAVLMEKPVCATVEQAIQLAEASERARLPVLVGHHRRHSPLMGRAREIIHSGQLGRLAAIHGFCWFRKPAAYFEGANSWRREPGGGPVMINLIHAVDDLRHLIGEIDTVQAMTSNQARGFPVEDTAAVTLGFRNGALGTLTLSDGAPSPWSWELTASETPAYPRTSESCYFVAGTAGSLSIPRLETWSHAPDGDWWTPIHNERTPIPDGESDPLVLQLRHFIDVARRKAAPVLDARGGARTLSVTLAILGAARSGQLQRIT